MKMNFRVLAVFAALFVAACQPSQPPLGPDGKPLPVAYKISAQDERRIPTEVLQQINTLRTNIGQAPLVLSPQLSAASLAHSRDMAAQNRAWHFGSDGSTPLDRLARAGFYGRLIGENISETYENEIDTLNAWMQSRDTRDVIMDPGATQLGIAWYQEPSGKIWWTLITGA